jgi:hypothetical protein
MEKIYSNTVHLRLKTNPGVGWGASAVDGLRGIKHLAFEERNPTFSSTVGFA